MRRQQLAALQRIAIRLGLACLVLSFAFPQEAQDGANGVRILSNDKTYQIDYLMEPEIIEFGERFSILVTPQRVDGGVFSAKLAVDARMPEHGHGMNREPQLEYNQDGSVTVTNLYFHMPGYWEVYFDFTVGAITERAQYSIDVD
ncbi:MAG: hypothetical protein ACI8X5_004104 [Planctomycetota bacterium]|jgi:hypothetical protein